MKETLYNQRFDDIYFSPEDGLAETRHVFLAGNGLPARWQGHERFTIAETGFGTGLNFLAAWALFEETAAAGAVLDYISFELYPLSVSEIRDALVHWDQALGGRLEKMLGSYPLRVKGFHRIQVTDRVRLTLVFDDVNDALPELVVPRGVDAWFLDGFAPSKNPEMWTGVLYDQMARLSAPGATAATFTVAGHVRRGLEAAGFAVRKAPGFGRKKDMCVARFGTETAPKTKRNDSKRIAVVGGGLAGTACAYVLGRQGAAVTIFEQADRLAAGASGNARGLYNPRFYAQRMAESDFYTASYAQAFRTLSDIAQDHDIGFSPCGALHLLNSPEKDRRFHKLAENGSWHDDHLRLLSPEEASALAGVQIQDKALYLPESGCVSPHDLCHAYARGADIRLHTAAEAIGPGGVNGEAFDAVVIASAIAVKDVPFLSWLPLHTVRGQVSHVPATAVSQGLKTNICYGGYICAPDQDGHMVGSTFQKWLDDTAVKDEDHRDNIARLAAAVPALGGDMEVTGGRAALRTASQDHLPVIGPACDENGQVLDGVYLSTAHGSHGILSSLAGAHLIADMILQNPCSLGAGSIRVLDGKRFIR